MTANVSEDQRPFFSIMYCNDNVIVSVPIHLMMILLMVVFFETEKRKERKRIPLNNGNCEIKLIE